MIIGKLMFDIKVAADNESALDALRAEFGTAMKNIKGIGYQVDDWEEVDSELDEEIDEDKENDVD